MSDRIYVLVEEGKVVWGPAELPRTWNNISGLNMMESAELKKLGWLPWREVLSPYDNKTHYRDDYNHNIKADEVVYTDIIKAYTVDQLEQNTWNDWSTDMLNSDDWEHASIHLPRQLEDIITMLVSKYPDILNEEGNEIIKKRYNEKRALRATKPPQP